MTEGGRRVPVWPQMWQPALVGEDEHELENDELHQGAGPLFTRGLVAGSGVLLANQLGPEAQALVAFGTPFAEAAIGGGIQRWREWTQTLGARAAGDGGHEALIAHLRGSPEAAALLSDAGYAASRTDYQAKLEAMGEAIAGGVLYEEGVTFDTDALVVRTICQLERTHVAVLGAIVSSPEGLLKEHVAEQLPQLRTAIPSILADLQALALVGVGRRQSTDLGRELKSKLRAAGGQSDAGAVIVRVLSDAHREQQRMPGYRGTAPGLDVVRRFADAATRVGDEELTGGATRPLAEVEEYMGLVLPGQSGWRGSSRDLDPGQRPVWVVDPQRRTCPTCGHEAVVRGTVTRMAGGNDYVAMGPEPRCPRGHSIDAEEGQGEASSSRA